MKLAIPICFALCLSALNVHAQDREISGCDVEGNSDVEGNNEEQRGGEQRGTTGNKRGTAGTTGDRLLNLGRGKNCVKHDGI